METVHYVHGRSDVGRVRAQNEDSFRVSRQGDDGASLLIVCDGMGGHEAGDVASKVAADRISEVMAELAPKEPVSGIYNALVSANQAVLAASKERGTGTMGTTAVVAWIRGDRCWVGWVGDSRFYLLRDGVVAEKSVDHTRVEQMVRHGVITREAAKNHPDAHILTQALGGGLSAQATFKPEVWAEPLELKAGDVVLLCSDGLYDLIGDGELLPLISGLSYQAAVDKLIATALERGGHDNVTVLLAVVGQPEAPVVGPAASAPTSIATAAPPPAPAPVSGSDAGRSKPGAGAAPKSTERVTARELPVLAAPPGAPQASSPAAPPAAALGRTVPLWMAVGAAMVGLALGFVVGLLAGRSGAPANPSAAAAFDAASVTALAMSDAGVGGDH